MFMQSCYRKGGEARKQQAEKYWLSIEIQSKGGEVDAESGYILPLVHRGQGQNKRR